MKRIFALLLVLCLSISVFAVALTACNNNDTPGGHQQFGKYVRKRRQRLYVRYHIRQILRNCFVSRQHNGNAKQSRLCQHRRNYGCLSVRKHGGIFGRRQRSSLSRILLCTRKRPEVEAYGIHFRRRRLHVYNKRT